MSVRTLVYPVQPVQVSTGSLATSANQVLEIAQLQDLNDESDNQTALQTQMASDLSDLNTKGAAALVTEANDYIEVTRVASGPALGEIDTAVYKVGGSGGTTVATLTFTYDGNGDFQSVTKS